MALGETPQTIRAGTLRARYPVYPGASSLRTLSECRILQMPELTLRACHPLHGDGAILSEPENCWQLKFLGSDLMADLTPVVWQQLLQRMKVLDLPSGSTLVREGDERAEACYVLAGGAAEVSARGRLLARLQLGDLFGEDSLITGERRSASVRMLSESKVMRLDVRDFRTFLLSIVEEGIYRAPSGSGRVLLRISSTRRLRERLYLLDRTAEYLISSQRREIVSLVVYLLRKQGMRAWAVG